MERQAVVHEWGSEAMTNDPATHAAQLAMANALNRYPVELVDHAPLRAEITRLRAELAASAEALERAAKCKNWDWNSDERTRYAAAATRARKGSVATPHGKDE